MLSKRICFILLLFFTKLQWSVVSEMYKISLRSVEACNNPDPPFEKQQTIVLNVKAYNKSGGFYFKGNVTVKKNLKGYYWKIKSGFEKSGTIKYTSNFKKLTCKSVIPKIILAAANIKYNEKTCELIQGNYTFNRMDLSKLDSGAYYYPIKEIGESVVYFSYFSSQGTSFCLLSRYVLKVN